jgi:hypothetical protein
MPIAVHIINTIFKKKRCTLEQLKVLALLVTLPDYFRIPISGRF